MAYRPRPTSQPVSGLDAAAERTGEVEVDGQAEEDAAGDQADADELVLAALDGAAQLVGRLLAPARPVGRGGAGRGGPARPLAGTTRGWPASRRSARLDEPDDPTSDGALPLAEPRVAEPSVRLLAVCFLDGPQVVMAGIHTVPRGCRAPGHRLHPGLRDPGSTETTEPSSASVTSSVPPSSDCTSTVNCTAPFELPAMAKRTMSESGRSSVTPSRIVAGSNVTSAAVNVPPWPARRRRGEPSSPPT